jgi:tRNA threonylcarbamoyladenosine modification (KEOPS) complex  Pcc1 subunit
MKIPFPKKHHLKIVLKALEPEIIRPPTMRSRATLKEENAFLVLNVEARDTIALRAAVNAYLRWICAVYDVCLILDSFQLKV